MIIGTPTVLNLIPGIVFPVVNVNQYDAGYRKTFLLYKGTEPFNVAANMSVTIRGTKGDKKGITDSVTSTTGSNLVSVTLTEQMTAVAGPNIYELRIVDTNGLLVGTINFVLMVEPAALGDGTVISDSELDYAADVLDKLQSVEAFKNQLDVNTTSIKKINRGYPLTDLILDGKITSSNRIQGGCYTENGNFVIYIAEHESDYGVLQCVNMDDYAIKWTSPRLKLYHGNAIAFRPNDRKLYIAPCYAQEDTSTLLNKILVVDYDEHQSIESEITPPGPGGIYSIAHDRETDVFYSTNYRGTAEGSANALYEYTGVFDSVNRVILLDDLSARGKIVASSQGVQCVADGIAYIPYYSPHKCIIGYSLETGAKISVSNLGRTTNDFKNIGEPQFVTHDGTDFYFGFQSVNTGIPGHIFWDICKIGIYHNIVVNSKLPARPSVSNDQWNTISFTFDLTKNDLRPTNLTGIFYSLSDAVRYQKVVQIYFVILVKNTSDPNNLLIGHIYASELNATIRPYDTSKTLKVEDAFFSASNITWQWCEFIGHEPVEPDSSTKANIVVARGSRFAFRNCSFPEIAGNTHAIFAFLGGEALADFKGIKTSYYAAGATNGTLQQNTNDGSPLIAASRLDVTSASVIKNLTVRILTASAMQVGDSIDLPEINRNAGLILFTGNGETRNVISTNEGIGTLKLINVTAAGVIQSARFEINLVTQKLTLNSLKLIDGGTITDGTSITIVLLQRF